MKIIKNILAGALLLFSSALFSQQDPLFSMYRNHMNMLNPAYAGVDGETTVAASVRRQWTGIGEGPSTQAASFGTSTGKNLGYGVSLVHDNTGGDILKHTSVGIDFSYKVKVDSGLDLYLGLKAGGSFFNADFSRLFIPEYDPSLISSTTFNPNVGVGALLKNKKFFMSVSIPRLLNSENGRNIENFTNIPVNRPHVYWSTGYDINLNQQGSLVLKPSFLLRYVNGAPATLDFNTMLQIQDYLEVGGMYRTTDAYAGIVNVILSKRFTVGFAYESQITTVNQLRGAGNTNELLVKFKF
ncbi:MAG: type IX secretion system membrane protein PorP/SprF [Bacteroidia bacterium]